MLGFVKTFWGQVFVLLLVIAILDKSTGFKTDVGAVTSASNTIITDLKV